MPMREMILPEFDQEMAGTRKMLERVPEKIPDYKPHEKSMALNQLAGHVAELPGWAKETMTQEVLVLDPATYQPFLPKTRQELLAKFDQNVSAGRKALESITDENLGVMWSLKTKDGHTIFAMPRAAVLRAMVLSHMIHHRAQLGVYLRLNNIEIPGVYGPSADEMKAWQAKNSQ